MIHRLFISHRNRGFSLMELLVVLAILGMALAVIPPMFGNVIESSQVKSAARELAAGLRQTRSLAVTRQQETALSLDVKKQFYAIGDRSRALSLPDDVDIVLTTAQSERSSQTQGAVRFFSDGSSTGGRISLGMDSVDYVIDIDWLTGRITISP